MTEVPVHVPLDCDLIGLPEPDQDAPQVTLDYARAVVREAAATAGLTTITFHDWLVTSGNRLVLLREALAAARQGGMIISTIAQNPDWLPDIALARLRQRVCVEGPWYVAGPGAALGVLPRR